MAKKILITATELHMDKFWTRHIEFLMQQGYEVDLVCSHVGDRLDDLKEKLKKIGNPKLTLVRLKRNPLHPKNILGLVDLKKYLKNNRYDVIITNEPVMGTMTRLAARKYRKKGTKVIYFAHGFHFFKGSSKAMWIVFYPIERFSSRFTDVLVTMNNEDFELAKAKMHAKSYEKIHGIGVDLSKFSYEDGIREEKRKSLGIDEDTFMLFTASELIKRKNLPLSVDIVKKLVNKGYNVKLFVRGEGVLEKEIREYIESQKMEDNVILLGYGKDIRDMCLAADADLFTSSQEGLPVALMEAMSCGLPCVVSDIRGAVDLIQNGEGGFVCNRQNADEFVSKIELLIERAIDKKNLIIDNAKKLDLYKIENVEKHILKMIES